MTALTRNGQATRLAADPTSPRPPVLRHGLGPVGKRVHRIEVMADERVGRAAQDTWGGHGVAQCGHGPRGQVTGATR